MSKNIDDFVDDIETIKLFRFRTFVNKTSAPKHRSYKTLSELKWHFFVFRLRSVRHEQYDCTNWIRIELDNNELYHPTQLF
jgi:hypothetical protein